MSYSTIEARIQTLIQALDDFGTADVVRGDYRVLDRGSAPYVVLRPGGFERMPHTFAGGRKTEWSIVVELFEKYIGDGTEQTNLEGHRQAIIDTADAYPTLNGLSGVHFATLSSGEIPRPVYDADGSGPFFLLQIMKWEVLELTTAREGEW